MYACLHVHRNIVRLRGVGAGDLTDLVSMRESMFVVQVCTYCIAAGGLLAIRALWVKVSRLPVLHLACWSCWSPLALACKVPS